LRIKILLQDISKVQDDNSLKSELKKCKVKTNLGITLFLSVYVLT